jgi:hypothetical protein
MFVFHAHKRKNAFEGAVTNFGRSTMEPAGAGRHGRERPERVGDQGGESINGGLIAESKGHFGAAEYKCQLKHEVDG